MFTLYFVKQCLVWN